jgi:hypothetical protein
VINPEPEALPHGDHSYIDLQRAPPYGSKA